MTKLRPGSKTSCARRNCTWSSARAGAPCLRTAWAWPRSRSKAIASTQEQFGAGCNIQRLRGSRFRRWASPPNGECRFSSGERKGRRYIAAGFDALDGRFPDFILVDGRYRVGCALESARRAHLVGKTALLMLDDYEGRSFYQFVEDHLGPPDRIGRAALFTIGGSAVSEDAVAQFATDPR